MEFTIEWSIKEGKIQSREQTSKKEGMNYIQSFFYIDCQHWLSFFYFIFLESVELTLFNVVWWIMSWDNVKL